MSPARRNGLLAATGCLGALVLATGAAATAYDDVFADYRQDGRITACNWSAATLDQALAGIPRDTDQYNPDFRQRVTEERDRVRSGKCGTTSGAARLRVVSVRARPRGSRAGPTRGTALRREWVRVRNNGGATVRLRGWSLANGQNRRCTLKRGSIAPRRSVLVRSGRGRSRGSNHYCGSRREIWRNGGDVAKLFAPERRLVQRYRYGSFR